MKTKLTILGLSGLALFSAAAFMLPLKKELPKKPNILFIFADDQAFNTIQHLGNEEVHTPNLDRLASSGVSFVNTYNMGGWNGAICAASRAMLNSGKSIWDAQKFQKYTRKESGQAQMWAKQMEKLGYNTYFTGKWHVNAPATKVFQNARNVRPGMPRDHRTGPKLKKVYELAKAGKSWEEIDTLRPPGYFRPISRNDNSWSPTDSTFGGFWEGGIHWTEVVKNDALNFLDDAKSKEEPFFMYLAFNATHDPRQAPQEFQDLYNTDEIEVPESFMPMYPQNEEMGSNPLLRDEALAPFPRTEYAVQVHRKEYYALLSHMDENIGKILDALEESGEADNTIIIFTADHGLAVGNHGLIGKQNMYEHSMKPPFIISGPGIDNDKQVEAPIYLQDAMATALDLAGAERPDSLFFNSVVPLATGESETSAYQVIYGAYRHLQRMIRKDNYKLIVYPEAHTVKLFDLESDPLELKDIANDPEQQERVKALFQDLLQLQKDMEDPHMLTDFFPELS